MVQMPGEFGEAIGWRVPFTLGHETAGRVAELGEGVTGLTEGEAVALTSPSSCGACDHCLAGRDSACLAGDAGRGYGRDGGLAGYVVAPVREVLPLGDLDPRTAGPLTDAGATRTTRSAGPVRRSAPGSTVVVVGVGGLGWFAVQILRATTEATDRRGRHRSGPSSDRRRAAVRDEVARRRAAPASTRDAVIDIVGDDATIAAGPRRAPAGRHVRARRFGRRRVPPAVVRWPAARGDLTTVQGSSIDDARQVIALAADGRVRVEVDEYPLERVADAYAALDAGTLRGRALSSRRSKDSGCRNPSAGAFRRASRGVCGLVGVDGVGGAQGDADVVEALEEALPGGVVERERRRRCRWPGPRRVRRSTSTVISSVGVGLDRAAAAARRPRPAPCTGTRPFLVQLLRKMSAKRGEITAWKP